MVWLEAKAIFDPDELGLPIVGIAAVLAEHDSGEHQHNMGQLLFIRNGCIRITLSGRLCMLPPVRVAWIPAKTKHRVEMKGVTGYRSVYIDTARIPSLANEIEVLEANPLLCEILERIALSRLDTDWQRGAASHLLALGLDEIHNAPREPVILRLPTDRRLINFNENELPPTLKEFSSTVGASEKTISRIFIRETGLNYQQWRQQWRFLKAVELLSQHKSVFSVASALGFSSDSEFVFFF
ncbi:helix-turn-helix transcriptional regulator [Arsenophonus sp.]|uniref:AraC family transcriptional regulator n=1 Tax=Arsenophonus sp. TaxID=1872640 RepID=UPI002858804C|nr:helix-turn-helix transcriptional regulator [Arsenophonus sp.]MDR5617869.1 helix-turn-helix transcriptional regulator [Arsenophonus sp.]